MSVKMFALQSAKPIRSRQGEGPAFWGPRESQGIPREHKAYFLSWILVWAIWPRYIHSDGLPEESARKKTRMVEFDVKSI